MTSFLVVDMGLQFGIQSHRQCFYRKSGQCVFHGRSRPAGTSAVNSETPIRRLSMHVRRYHAGFGFRSGGGTGPYRTYDRFYFRLEHPGLRRHCLLDLESEWVEPDHGRLGFCR